MSDDPTFVLERMDWFDVLYCMVDVMTDVKPEIVTLRTALNKLED